MDEHDGPARLRDLPDQGRLDSWKAIAAYLQRDVRTIQRWERAEDLPVHRHAHNKQASVYAYRAELDAWLTDRTPRSGGEPARGTLRLRTAWLVLAFACVGAVTVLWVVVERNSQRPSLELTARHRVLVTDFENRTGEALLDGTVEAALAGELSNSRFVRVVPRERIANVLHLMRLPVETPVDQTLGREISERDGEIRALLTGTVRKIDSTYLVRVSLIDPDSGLSVAAWNEEARDREALLDLVQRLPIQVDRRLGEALANVGSDRPGLAKVTTSSLQALRLYTQADAVIAGRGGPNGDAIAEELLRRATAEEPAFASAFMLLAHAVRNQGRPASEYRSLAQRAFDLIEVTSERERYFILGGYHAMFDRIEEAVDAYQTLVTLYPGHYWGLNNLAGNLQRLGNGAPSARLETQKADLRPNDFRTNFMAAHQVVQYGASLSLALPYADRARQLMRAGRAPQAEEWQERWLGFLPMYERWMADDTEGALEELRALAEIVDLTSGSWASDLGRAYLLLGKLQAADEAFQQVADSPMRRAHLRAIVWLRGNPQLRLELPTAIDTFYSDRREAADFLANLSDGRFGAQSRADFLRGQLALDQGHTSEAIALFEAALTSLPAGGPTRLFVGTALAGAWEAYGDLEQALRVLDEASSLRGQLFVGHLGPAAFWLHVEANRVRLSRMLGLDARAEQIEARLRRLLALADNDHELARGLRVPPEEAFVAHRTSE